MSRIIKTTFLLSSILILDFATQSTVTSANSESSPSNCFNCATPRFSNDDFSSKSYRNIDSKVERFMHYWDLKGASLAIAKDGKLLFAKGYGFADVDKQTPVEPYSRFRVASISKLVTAAAIMRLVEEKKVSLDDKVFGPKGILNDTSYGTPKDARMYDITVRELLNHSGGWSARYGDQMFMSDYIASQLGVPKPLKLDDIIRFVFSKRLHFKPGTHSSYSNFGYALLGKVIEKVTNTPYEQYVRINLLNPLGITSMAIGRSTRDSLFSDEVSYYEVPEAKKIEPFNNNNGLVNKSNGGYNIKMLGAAGGWVASSVDLIKLALALDGDESVPDLIPQNLVDTMITRPRGFLPIGWIRATQEGRLVRTGNFAGTSAILVKEPDGVCWVFLTNTSPWVGSKFPSKISGFMHGVLKTLPELDYAESYSFKNDEDSSAVEENANLD